MRRCSDWIDSYVKMMQNTEPPDLFHRWVAVSCIASCLQRKCVFPWGRLRFYPNMYIVLIAPPGIARKGTAMDPAMQMLEEPRLNIKLAAEAVTREQLIRELRNSETMITTSSGKMMSHCSLTICNSELTVFLGYHNIQLLSDLTDWYDCKRRWTYRTKNSGTDIIDGVWVNILGATTPQLIRSALPLDAIGGGLASRIMFIYAGKKKQTVPYPGLSQEEEIITGYLQEDLERILMMTGEFRTTPQFIDAWTEWYMHADVNRPFSDELFAGYCERRPATVLKLSIIMSAAHDDSMIIDTEDLFRAISFVEEAELFMPLALSGIGQGKHADVLDRIMQYITRKGGKVEISDIMWQFRNDLTRWELERLIESLESSGFCNYMANTHLIIMKEGRKPY